MEHKYYTPTIEEFHVGFEYEFLSFQDETWRKAIVTVKDESVHAEHFSFIDTEKHLDRRRVKYLDREDIESLGFILNVVDCGEDTQHNELGIRRNEEGGYFGTFFLDDTHGECNIQIFESFYRIKNKSELKRLLKQLGIDA